MARHKLMWAQRVVGVKHLAGEVPCDGLGSEMKITKHFVRTPAPEELDDVGINLSNEEGHRACRSKRASRDFTWKEPQISANIFDCIAERLRDQCRCNRFRASRSVHSS